MSVPRRALLVLPVAVLATGGWMPREESTYFVMSLYEKEGVEWPDLSAGLHALFEADSKRPARRVDFNWLQGGPQRQSQMDGLRVNTLTSKRGKAVVEAVFTNHGQAYTRRFMLVRERKRWVIEDAQLEPEGKGLVEMLTGGRGKIAVADAEQMLAQRVRDATSAKALFTIADLIDVAIAFYEEVDVSGLADHGDQDMLLFQYAAADGGSGLLEIDVVRQFMQPMDDDDRMSQLHLTSVIQTAALPAFHVWCATRAGVSSFRQTIEASPGFRAVSDLRVGTTAVEFELI